MNQLVAMQNCELEFLGNFSTQFAYTQPLFRQWLKQIGGTEFPPKIERLKFFNVSVTEMIQQVNFYQTSWE